MNQINISKIAESDRAALKEIYQTITGGDVELNEKYWVRKDEKHFRQRCDIRGDQGWSALYAGAKADQKGRITYLSLSVKKSIYRRPFDLPVAIGKLEKLEELFLIGCVSLPESLSDLPNLKKLILGSSRQIFQNDSVWKIKLPHLNLLRIYQSPQSGFQVPLTAFFPWIHENLPRLQTLHVQGGGKFESKTWDPPNFGERSGPHNFLERVTLPSWDMDEKQLEILMFDVLPSFPMVSLLNVSHNKISSFGSFHERLKHNTIPSRPRLLTLDMNYNPHSQYDTDRRAVCLPSGIQRVPSAECQSSESVSGQTSRRTARACIEHGGKESPER